MRERGYAPRARTLACAHGPGARVRPVRQEAGDLGDACAQAPALRVGEGVRGRGGEEEGFWREERERDREEGGGGETGRDREWERQGEGGEGAGRRAGEGEGGGGARGVWESAEDGWGTWRREPVNERRE